MPTPPAAASPPSLLFCLACAAPPAAIWCCFLPFRALCWPWLLISIALPYTPIHEALLGLVHLYAAYSAIQEAEWQSWWSVLLGSFLLAKAMGLAHESLWDAFEPLLIGSDGHGAGKREPSTERKPASVLDKDGKPLGPQSCLVPGTQLRLDAHDGRGYLPYVIPGKPVFGSERKAIEAFFTSEELDALKAADIRPWDERAPTVIAAERADEIRREHGLWGGPRRGGNMEIH